MKKSLFALAAVTAFAGAAQAQSSVTVYGILDVGYVGGNERIAGPVINGNRVTKQNTSGFGDSAQSTSRLGFRGREDLGGGTAALFTLEWEIDPNTSTGMFGNTRTAIVGLSQKGYGTAAIGTQNTVIVDAMSPTLTGQFNNIVGSLMFPGANYGPSGGTTNISGSYLDRNSANGNTAAFTFRTANTLKLQTERFAGFSASGIIVMDNETDTQGSVTVGNTGYTGGKNNQNGWGLGAAYTYKKFLVTAAYQSFTATNPYVANAQGVVAPGTAGAPAPFGNPTTGTNVKDNQAYVGATYDFGILKAYGSWINRKVTSKINANQFASRSAQEIGVRGNWTPKIESWASMGNGRVQTFGTSEPTANLTGWQIGTNYILSKRTNLYAIYGQSGTSNVSNRATGVNQSYNANNYALGVRHTF